MLVVTFTAFLVIVCAIAHISIGVYVLRINPRSAAHRAFFFVVMPTAVWAFALALTHSAATPTLWCARLAFASGSLVPIALLTLAENFPRTVSCTSRTNRWILTPIGIGFSILSWSPWLIAGASLKAGEVHAIYGPLHGPFALYVSGCFGFAIYTLYSSYRGANGLLRVQSAYLLIAMAVPAALTVVTNVLVPVMLGSSKPARYGPLFTFIMLVLIGHAILRHRFMDIRVVVKQGVVYLAAFAVAGAVLLSLLIASSHILRDGHWFNSLEILMALSVAVLFHPLKTRIQLAFDRYLYREPYNYQRIIRETSRTLSNTIELPAILDCAGGTMRDTLKPEWAAVYLLDEDEGQIERVWSAGARGEVQFLPPGSALMERAAAMKVLIFRDELVSADSADVAVTEMTRLNADVAAPLLAEGRLFGLIVLGPKRSGSPYFSDDADLLQTLAHQSAVAIRNAQTHQRVVQVNEELRKTLATIQSGVITVGSRGRISVTNKAAEQFTGLSAEALRGRGTEQLPPVLARLIEATLEDGQSRSQVEIALPDPVGQMVPLMCTASPLRNPQGALVGAVAVFSDLSRLRELERERRRAERLASMEAIASGMVHEIRNPLVAIKTFTQLLPTRFNDPGFRDTFSRVAGREIARVDDLLDRFRMLSSASRQPMEPVDVTAPIGDTLQLLQPRLEERRVSLRRVGETAPRPVLGNASQLEQLFLNLCLNALEAMDSGGELTVRVADLSEGGGSTLLVEVSDTGGGIPDDMLEQIFNPFVTTKDHGTGLGLAICRAITDAHRAVLRARNNIGRPGCTFTVEFPVPVAKPARVPA
jgi:PAS domain S-box-containing protein